MNPLIHATLLMVLISGILVNIGISLESRSKLERIFLSEADAKTFHSRRQYVRRKRALGKIIPNNLHEECREGCSREELLEVGYHGSEIFTYMKEFNCKNKAKCGQDSTCIALTQFTIRNSMLHVTCKKNGGWSKWGNWSTWTECTPICGDSPRKRQRSRRCDNPYPQAGGAPCTGSSVDEQTENCASLCSNDGNWGSWGEWSTCGSRTCGTGLQTRFRTCDSPALKIGGNNCAGPGFEVRLCDNLPRCPAPVDGNWGTWGPWSACAQTCAPTEQTRVRQCDNPAPQHRGYPCSGQSRETKSCNNLPSCTPVNGGWSAWSAWESCLDTCGNGTGIRQRLCDNPEPRFGGAPCLGPAQEGTPMFEDETNTTNDIPFRLYGGKRLNEGRAEYKLNGAWGSICDDGFGGSGWPAVICRDLGFPGLDDVRYARETYIGIGSGDITLHNPGCNVATAKSMADCFKRRWINCSHNEDVVVTCSEKLRLFGGQTQRRGRVEYYRNGTWGTVCDSEIRFDTWLKFACNSLNYPDVSQAIYAVKTDITSGNGSITLHHPYCSSKSMTSFSECKRGYHRCNHTSDVVVTCARRVRLVNGEGANEGIVEFYKDGIWGTVCAEKYGRKSWPSRVCRELGYEATVKAVYAQTTSLNMSTGAITLMRPKCKVKIDKTLEECVPDGGTCTHAQDIVVRCSDKCLSDQFKCTESTACLDPDDVCNGIEDCPTGEDERNCTKRGFRFLRNSVAKFGYSWNQGTLAITALLLIHQLTKRHYYHIADLLF